MLELKDFMELEKLAEDMAETRKAVGVAIEQNCSDAFWCFMMEKAHKANRAFYEKLYAMRLEVING